MKSRKLNFLRRLNRDNDVVVLMYHGFFDAHSPTELNNYHGKHLEIQKFRNQIQYLKEHYQVISLKHLIAFYERQESIPKRSVVLTFDDGYQTNYTLAFKVLQEYNVPASIFVTTDFIDQKDYLWMDRVEYALAKTKKQKLLLRMGRLTLEFDLRNLGDRIHADRFIKSKLKRLNQEQRDLMVLHIEQDLAIQLKDDRQSSSIYLPLTWQQITQMVYSGLITIGSHTSSHTILTAMDQSHIQEELERSQQRIRDMVRIRCDLFSYPNGGMGDFNLTTQQMIRNLNFRCALTTMVDVNKDDSNVFQLNRLNIHNDGDLVSFKRTLSPGWRLARKIKNEYLFRDQS